MYKALLKNGYPPSVVNSSKEVVRSGNRTSMEKSEPSATVILPYIRNVSESIRRILTPLNIRTCFRPNTTLRRLLVHPKTLLPAEERTGVVYSIPCSTCDEIYIGQTGRTLQHRVKEHKRALSTYDGMYNTSAVAEHAIKRNHQIGWQNATVLDYEQNLHQRCYLESWHIQKANHAMNRDTGTLPEIYKVLQQGNSLASS